MSNYLDHLLLLMSVKVCMVKASSANTVLPIAAIFAAMNIIKKHFKTRAQQ